MNREKIRTIKRRSKRDDKYFINVINKHSLGTNRIETYKIYNTFINDEFFKKKLHEIYLPSDLKALNNKKMIYNEKLSKRDTIEWATFLIDLFNNEINKYLLYKQIYERFLFSQQYDEAYSTLLIIEKEVCVSLWSSGQKLLLEEQIRGLEANKKLLEKFFQETKYNLIVNALLEFYSYIAEDNMSYLNYQDKVKKFIELLGDQDAVKNYFSFKLNLDHRQYKDFKSIIQIDSQLSIIDLYNSYLEILQIESFECQFQDMELMIAESMRKIKDYSIRNILVRYSKWDWELLDSNIDESNEVFEIIELYTKGDYLTSIQKLNAYLSDNSNDFQMILLLIKSHINAYEEMSPKYPIYQDLYNIYTVNKSTNESFTNLYRYLKLYSGTSWKYKLRGFISRKLEFTSKNIDGYLSYINDLLLTPNFVGNLSASEDKKQFLEIFKKLCPITTSLFLYMNSFTGELCSNISLDPLRKKLFIATKKIESNNFDEAIKLLTSIKDEVNKDDHYILERVLRKLLLAYKNNNLLLECVQLIVEAYFINENLIKRFELSEIIQKVKKSDDVLIKKNLMYPILIYLYDKNDYKSQRIAYSNYMDYNQLNSVEDIIDINININTSLLVYFLHKICVQHLIKRDIRLAANGSLADEVRTEILRQLINLDSANRKLYYDEINSIMTKRGIRDRIKQINQSRIFVDVENIKIENRDILIENFNKYIAVKKFEDDLRSIDITSEEYLDVIKNIVSEMNSRIKADVTYSQEVVILKGIISKIKEEFLYNEKYGLNTFLSSRIRHGYVNSQLTTLFYEHNLMSKTANDGSDIYSINEYWDKLVTEESTNFKILKQYLSDFTNIIDKKVTEIKNEWIRIRYTLKDTGVLDYSTFVNQCLVVVEVENIVDFDVFFETVINLLWKHTKELLTSLRNKIEIELKSYLINSLNNLEIDMKKLQNTEVNNLVIEVNKNINLCKVKLESVIKEFSDVFYNRDVLYLDYSMSDLVATCLEISYKLNNNFNNVQLEKEIQVPYKFNGMSFLYFVDILNIILNNALEHSGVEDYSKLKLDIIIREENSPKMVDIIQDALKEKNIGLKYEKFMMVTVRNNLGDGKDIEQIQRKVQEVFDNVKSHEILKKYTQTEGGSGLYKLYKTLQYNIIAPYSILYDVTNQYFEISLFMGIDNLILKEGAVQNEDIICRR
ncbi:hypothetical protein [Metabacillus fastidiosus]|uniref:hypothetical protein n=1 Tax=Metabacillus fastidiosus TaxID=1458 RepID=UPI002DBD993D|nr:hypothetical protein [Metabacillus fastidiosus]MEC2076311.1 hypothetical protein [Metabacillus fastidiosus]